MVTHNLKTNEYQSREAKLFILKEKADKISDFIRGLRGSKSKVYLQIMREVTGIESLVTLQSLLLQVSLYYRKTSDSRLNDLLEVNRAHKALYHYYNNKDFSLIVDYMKELKKLFELIKED
jgi:hypothetical protein